MKKKNVYDESSIKVLKGLDGVRKRPSMYIGDTGNTGFHHLVWEILDNSVDEAVSGYCKNIILTFYNDGSVCIVDDGRGIPVKEHPTEKIPTVDVVLTMLHAGGKFDQEAFKNSGGLHGVGAAVVNALSYEMDVIIWRNGHEWFRKYIDAEPTSKELLDKGVCKNKTGTKIKFKPNLDIFKRCEFDKSIIQRRLRELSYLNAGVKFVLKWEKDGTVDTYYSEDGLIGYVNYLTKKRKLLHNPVRFYSNDIEGTEVDLVFVYDDKYDSQIHSFANNISTHEGGVHYNAALDSISKSIEDHAIQHLKKLNLGVNKTDVMEGLTLVISVRIAEPKFGGQTKTKLNNSEIRWPLGNWILKQMNNVLDKNKEFANVIVSKIIEAIKARDASRKVKSLQRKKSVVEMSVLTGKLKDCSSKKSDLCELFIVEGDSAGGTACNARNRQYQAILPLRGKPLNVNDKTFNSCLSNKEIASIISALGINVTPNNVNIDDLRYNKVIIMSDADPDGGHISCLLITLFYKFMRKIIEDGHLYICDLPLYRVQWKGKSKYLKDDLELEDFKNDNKNVKIEVSRFKGLGEMSIEELEETAMNPKTRILRKICIEDDNEASEIIDNLMGNNVGFRKEFLTKALKFEGNDV